MKKIGLDIHGVIDFNPQLFSSVSKELIRGGHEVHIITGAKWTETIENQLAEMDIVYTHHFSIVDYALQMGVEVTWDESGPKVNDDFWDSAKGIYCSFNSIDVHFDDTPHYGEYFENIPTRFVTFQQSWMSMPMVVRQIIASIGDDCDNYPCKKNCPQYILYKQRAEKAIHGSIMYDLAYEMLESIDPDVSDACMRDNVRDLVDRLFEEFV